MTGGGLSSQQPNGPWSVREQLNGDGRIGIYFEYRNHTIGRFSGSRENADWMVTCINAAHACYELMSRGVAAEAGYEDTGAVFAALGRVPVGTEGTEK